MLTGHSLTQSRQRTKQGDWSWDTVYSLNWAGKHDWQSPGRWKLPTPTGVCSWPAAAMSWRKCRFPAHPGSPTATTGARRSVTNGDKSAAACRMLSDVWKYCLQLSPAPGHYLILSLRLSFSCCSVLKIKLWLIFPNRSARNWGTQVSWGLPRKLSKVHLCKALNKSLRKLNFKGNWNDSQVCWSKLWLVTYGMKESAPSVWGPPWRWII